MASKQSTVEFILEQMADAGAVFAKKMFGEYAIYCDGKNRRSFVTSSCL